MPKRRGSITRETRERTARRSREMRLMQDAASFAARAHRNQFRKDGVTPYIAHPFRVAMFVRHVAGCEDASAIAAALLHDTIEDCVVDYDDLESRFGTEVADVVACLTKNMFLREDKREEDYDERLARGDWRARLIKVADAYDNYTDTAGISEAMRIRARERALRAIALATPDVPRHPETGNAVRALAGLIRKNRRSAKRAGNG